jgi:hypothetical protein
LTSSIEKTHCTQTPLKQEVKTVHGSLCISVTQHLHWEAKETQFKTTYNWIITRKSEPASPIPHPHPHSLHFQFESCIFIAKITHEKISFGMNKIFLLDYYEKPT